eukprot:6949643-Pyramimonas_sp.AAC.1
MRRTLEDLKVTVVRMRLCHFGIRFSMRDSTPSGAYMQVATSIPISSKLWACTCKLAMPQHILDWYGQA